MEFLKEIAIITKAQRIKTTAMPTGKMIEEALWYFMMI